MRTSFKKNNPSGVEVLVGCGVILALAISLIAFLGWLTMVLWNFVMPQVFGLPPLSWGEGVAFYLLVALVVGVIRGTTGK